MKEAKPIKRKSGFVVRLIGTEKVLIPCGDGLKDLNGLVVLNETAAYIWEALAEESSLDTLAHEVAKSFEVPIEIARQDVESFIRELTDMGVIE